MRAARLPLFLVLLCGGWLLALNLGVRQSMGLFIPSMITDLGWTASTFALAFGLQNLLWGLTSPAAGMIADRYGTARVLIAGALLYVAGLALTGLSTSPWMLHGSTGVLIGLGVGATTFPLVLGAVGRLVSAEKRSFALGVASTGGSLGQFVFAPVTGWLNDGLGYTMALLVLALICLSMVPAGLALAGRAEEGPSSAESAGGLGEAIGEAARHRGYLLLNAGFFVCGFHVALIAVHLPFFAALCGLPGTVAAQSLAVIGLFNVFGTLLAGWLGGRYRQKWLLSGIYGLRALVILGFLLAPKTAETFLVFAAAIGMLWLSTVPLTSSLVARVFGARYLASLFGVVMLSHQIGAFIGASLGGIVYDLTGSYDAVWLSAAALGMFAALVHLPIGDRALRPAVS